MNLSVVIITKNEAHNIARCILSCQSLHTEIIILDSHSTDETMSIAENLGATVYTIDWQGYGATKNLGAAKATNDWILSLDADEELSDALIRDIKRRSKNFEDTTALFLKRKLVFNGKKILYGAYGNERHIRLYNKNKLQWNLNSVHEMLEPTYKNQKLIFKELSGHLLHYSYTDIDDLQSRLEKYAQLGAQDLIIKSKVYLVLKKIFSPAFTFLKNYFLRLGFLDGGAGYILARAHANYIFKKYNYALQQKK